ncbi:hypothetical protein G6F70_003005 [Rhizopus microsporus]|uniref:PH domain-containing protein n=2 Tax=Rhizopus TaxID=4842 RepID=A0A367KBZ0_RHIAZ|nr:hypothetical protein G6F71_000476 [Rhizopus microsporus]RCH99609.1 hypothetical protein CU097_011850 [Rhizopus azygosporus]KAG1201617.1 hypothetical protein G6F70_003005 [Rhizopus microsporus]KAG1215540.1 hypothetical protein G6F69_000897 [Rhizopus microsporus]KAG1238794.1 hypothetical protein G6F67_000143 [Rhizopus microsporus]
MTILEPPPRPNKSKLRTLRPDGLSLSPFVTPTTSPTEVTEEDYFSLVTSSSFDERTGLHPTATPSHILREQPKYRSRFTEHFDDHSRDIIEEEFAGLFSLIQPSSPRPSKPEQVKQPKSLAVISENPAKSDTAPKKALVKSSSTNTVTVSSTELANTSPGYARKNSQPSPSLSTPLQSSKGIPSPRKFGSSGSILNASSTPAAGSLHSSVSEQSDSLASNIATKLNRADVIIERLESWNDFLKSITGWLEEVAKINMQSGRGYLQKAGSYLNMNIEDSEYIRSLQNGLQTLVNKLSSEQQDLSSTIHRDHLPGIYKLRKECKEKIQRLKADTSLSMDELYRRAEVTRSKMNYLNRCCKQAERMKGQIEMDPWLANLHVLRQLKREVDEENRLRLLMIPIQNETKEFEQRLFQLVKPAIDYCCKALEKEPIMMIPPEQEWSQFCKMHQKELVDEQRPIKNYLKINYPNKLHPFVMTLIKGPMKRRVGVRKQFIERYYVLSQGGYLHQFTMDNKVSPEKTIYIPSVTVIPSIDLSSALYQHYSEDSYTFEICRPGANVLQKDKVSVFRTTTKQELIDWCTCLVQVASGNLLTEASSNISHPSSPTYSGCSAKSNESMLDPSTAQGNRIRKSSFPSRTPLHSPSPLHSSGLKIANNDSFIIEPSSAFSTDSQIQDSAIHCEEEDRISIASNSTAKMPLESGSRENNDEADRLNSNENIHGQEENKQREPSVISTIFDDAQSSVYFSSTSAPPSPALSAQSSIISFPSLGPLEVTNEQVEVYKPTLSLNLESE